MGDASKLWSEGPIICNVDPKVMPHFSFHAKCNYCEEIIAFTTELEREMRKHYNLKHRLYCNACKKSDFNTREELNTHLSAFHKDGICFNCHASFKLASAVAMHVEGPRNDCAVPHTALVNALRNIDNPKILEGLPVVTDTNSIYSPVSCCSNGENTVLKLKEFKKTLLLAHKKAFYDMQQASSCAIDFPQPLGNEGVNSQQQRLGCNVAASENVTSPKPMEAVPDSQAGCDSPQVKRMVSESISNRDVAAQDMTSSLDFPIEDQLLWTCSTCVDAKFTTLSKLLQHVEQKVRNSWWMSLHH
ncbi:hypothetical protein M758_4G198600 [Ceratodon purpureus]|nr:hypothetical protein M758_4G198600 [Ceratodon purpureus]